MPTFPNRKAQNSQKRQLQAILDTYRYSTSAFVPSKTHKVRKIHSYNDLRKLAKQHFCCSSSPSVELAYRQSGTSTLDGFYTKRLLSVRGGTTVSRDCSLIAIFADTATYLPLKIHGVTWHFPASAEATLSEDPQRLVANCTYHSLYLKKKNRTRANTYCSSDLQREVVEVM